jgi:hypothetical protein
MPNALFWIQLLTTDLVLASKAFDIAYVIVIDLPVAKID